MSLQKRNEYLDAPSSSDNESVGYDSEQEAAADSRTAGLASHRSKRQKLSATPSDAEEEEEQEEEGEQANQASYLETTTDTTQTNQPSAQPSAPLPHHPPKTKKKPPPKPGVVYLSRIPPYMPPHLVRHHLLPHGPILNIFLTPEPPSQRSLRLSRNPSANRKRTYTDGWIEFRSRRHARACAEAINGSTVGGKKGGWYRDDVWSAKYLRGFRWGDLMEGVRREEREREERVRVGVGRDRREREAFLRGVEGGRKRGENKRKVGAGEEEKGEVGVVDGMVNEGGGWRGRGEQSRFRQSDVKGREKVGGEQPDEVTRVLSKIF